MSLARANIPSPVPLAPETEGTKQGPANAGPTSTVGAEGDNYRYWREHGLEWGPEYTARKLTRPKFHIQELILAQAASRMAPGRVLEFGCGVGRHLQYLSSIPQLEVFGVDQSPTMVEHMRSWATAEWLAERVKLIPPITPLPFDTAAFDLVFTCEVLIHVRPEHLRQVLSELLRVSRGHVLHIEATPGEEVIASCHDGCWSHDLQGVYASLGVQCQRLGDAHGDQSVFYVNLTPDAPAIHFDPAFFERCRNMERDLEKGFALAADARAQAHGELEQVTAALARTREALSRSQEELARTKEQLSHSQEELGRTQPHLRHFESVRRALRQMSPDAADRVALSAGEALAEIARTTVFPELIHWVTTLSEQQRELRFLKKAGTFQLTRKLKDAATRLPLNSMARRLSGRGPSIEVESLTTRNPRSQGHEVWLLSCWFTDFGGYFPLEHALFEPGTFEPRPNDNAPHGHSLVTSRPARVQLFQSPQGARLMFLRHGWSGHVALTVDGNTQVIDLYSEQPDSIEVDLSSYPFSIRVACVNRFAAPLSQR
ncbi:methyltransferase domain-containing protein [Pyxidicoccus fallax]|uniref:Methyltransferase domain-containing protein n=1 Tax=Pyxidicoccus fallax TaxID=394095 RepID=A0A848LJS4_9BACT|nr:class I SAM-dependent methyltransferase [Pyxidicoccus fallax]NMO17960.1 methyltransferase domain-containing protein [Pyxidicoccus fallax]NPC78991.1 methyltransferase domain-containing protein [Pyxidicoccus fallax]